MSASTELLVFDWDGTLVDSVGRILGSLGTALAAVGAAPLPAARLRAVIGLGLHDIAGVLMPDADSEACAAFVEAYRAHWLAPGAPTAQLFDGADSTVRTLHGRAYRIAVATGKSRRGLDRELGETGLRDLVVTSRCADETRSKPDPQMLREVLQETGVAPEHAIMIGDTEHDLAMARTLGVPSIAVSYGVQSLDELRAFDPVHCIDNVVDLLDVLPGASSR